MASSARDETRPLVMTFLYREVSPGLVSRGVGTPAHRWGDAVVVRGWVMGPDTIQGSLAAARGLRRPSRIWVAFGDSAAVWAVTVGLGIHGGWGRNGEPISFDMLMALGMVLLAEALVFVAAAVRRLHTTRGIVRRLTWLWAVGFAWMTVLWLSAPSPPAAFLDVWFAMGVALGWILMAAFGVLVELIGLLVPRRLIALGILVLLEAVIVRWVVLPLVQFYNAYPWGSVLDAKHAPILPFGPTVAVGADHAWPIAAVAGTIGLAGWLIQQRVVHHRGVKAPP